jgi:serine phosphatase RsbU (regulator of sigma subunit)
MATAICLRLDDDEAVLSSAGHPAAIVISPDGTLREVPQTDPMLGAFKDLTRHDERVPIASGELLVIYTDGVTDLRAGPADRFGHERLRRFLSSQAGANPGELVSRLETELAAFSSEPGGDDIAVLVACRDC